MWDMDHKLYTVFVLESDKGNFPLGCVDAEFPHFPFRHWKVFSALLLSSVAVVAEIYIA